MSSGFLHKLNQWLPVATAVLLVTMIGFSIGYGLNRVGAALDGINYTVHYIKDCTATNGKCHKENAENVTGFIQSMATVFRYELVCQNNPNVPNTVPAQTTCYNQLVKEFGLGGR